MSRSLSSCCWILVLLGVLSFCLVGLAADEKEGGSDPGEVNPVAPAHYGLFSDDELLWLAKADYFNYLDFYEMTPDSDDLDSWSTEQTHDALPNHADVYIPAIRPMASAAGYVTYGDVQDVAFAYFHPSDEIMEVRLYSDGAPLARRASISTTLKDNRSLDLAVGDLDAWVDDEGLHHDEIVVVHTADLGVGAGLDLQVNVLDQDLNVISSDSWMPGIAAQIVAVTIGDFDGDRINEFAVAATGGEDTYMIYVAIYRFGRNADGVPNHNLHRVATKTIEGSCYGMDMTAGDFDGDQLDELFMVYNHNGTEFSGIAYAILTADEHCNIEIASKDWLLAYQLPRLGQLRTVSGLFVFDPNDGLDVNTSQAAVCFADRSGTHKVNCVAYELLDLTTPEMIVELGAFQPYDAEDNKIGSLDIAAGNFIGHGVDGTGVTPEDQLAVVFNAQHTINTDLHDIFFLVFNKITSHGSYLFNLACTQQYTQSVDSQETVAAMDADGDSWELGPPAHIIMEEVLSLDYVIQEPPKHVDYLPSNPDDPEDEWEWEMFNIGGYTDFNVEFEDRQSNSTENTSKSNTTSTIGGGASLDVKESCTFQAFGLEKITTSIEDSMKLNYEYDSNESSYNSSYLERTTTYTSATSLEDNLRGRFQNLHVWRYPIIGFDTGDPDNPYGMYEIILPGANPETFVIGGLEMGDIYQPLHENHNILSYPQFKYSASNANATWKPSDVGTFTIPDPDHPGPVSYTHLTLPTN